MDVNLLVVRNSTSTRFIAGFLILFLAFSCDNDSNGDELLKDRPINISELAGNWEATQAVFGVSSQYVDIVEDGGTVTMTVYSSGRFTINLNQVDRPAATVSGEMFPEIWEGSYYFPIAWDDKPDDKDTYGHTSDGITLTLNRGADTGE